MGNRAVITTSTAEDIQNSSDLGIYLHWNGGRDSVEPFLTYCRISGVPSPETDPRGWEKLCKVIGNFLDERIVTAECSNLDCDNIDNGVYVINNWQIVDRKYFSGYEQNGYGFVKMLFLIDSAQPEKLGADEIEKRLAAIKNELQ